jgi:hypothetical protein
MRIKRETLKQRKKRIYKRRKEEHARNVKCTLESRAQTIGKLKDIDVQGVKEVMHKAALDLETILPIGMQVINYTIAYTSMLDRYLQHEQFCVLHVPLFYTRKIATTSILTIYFSSRYNI